MVVAPLVVLADALSFLLSALLLTRVRATREAAAPDPAPARRAGRRTGELAPLARSLVRNSGMQALAAVAFVNSMVEPVLILFLVRDLHLRASVIGLLLALGAVGGVVGGLLVGRIMRRRGPGVALGIGAASMVCSMVALPFAAAGPVGAGAVVIFELAGSFGGTLMIATVFGTLQSTAPAGKVGRLMALAMMFLQVAAVFGAPVGGLLGTFAGLRATIATGAVLILLTVVPQLLRWRAAGWKIEPEER